MKLPSTLTVGIIGGGQLGKMLIEASRPWNLHNIVLENDPHCPASLVASEVITGKLTDGEKIRELAGRSDVLTWEIEHVDTDTLISLEAEGKRIIPSPRTLKIIQDKGLQKNFYAANNIRTVPFKIAYNKKELLDMLDVFPGDKVVLKNCTGGYDGKGVSLVLKSEITRPEFDLPGPVVVEELIEDMVESSVIVARDELGNVATFPSIEMYFDPVSNLVQFLFSPGDFSAVSEQKCRELAIQTVQAFGSPGLFAVEMFITGSGEVYVNEIAPRPHNSGHHTIEGCLTSQFEQLNRILMGLPLGDTSLVSPCAMINLVGPEGLSGKYQLANLKEILSIPGVYIHLYNKAEIKPNRKMGHITVLAETKAELFNKAEQVKRLIAFIPA